MKRGEVKRLTEEDRILWSRVASTATPLPGKRLPPAEPEPPEEKTAPPSRSPQPRLKADSPVNIGERHPRRLDAPTRKKLARGHLGIAGRVDLHGLTQKEAHALLLSFLRQAYISDRRSVLVIMGKGTARGEGVLRKAVPQWLGTSPFSEIVGGYEEAARHHGGGGALYVRLRRRGRTP